MENKIQLAAKAFSESTKPNISQLAREFDIPYHRLRARIHSRFAYISPTPKMIKEATNTILKKASEDRVVGYN
ncbi:hypothetical protein N7465_002201 [Penicillium sp. CMV-2018d]|nr:hypothetical protein N7465_002201 [Penicillium sp. CMV-2018d]